LAGLLEQIYANFYNGVWGYSDDPGNVWQYSFELFCRKIINELFSEEHYNKTSLFYPTQSFKTFFDLI
jgi:hypothetical protein